MSRSRRSRAGKIEVIAAAVRRKGSVEASRQAGPPRGSVTQLRAATLPQSPINTSVTPEAGDEPPGHR